MALNVEYELQRLGLTEREARVYLAALELGPSPVQKIAQRARVPRATTYLVLDDLKHRGLTGTYRAGKKAFFTAQRPECLHDLVAEREAEFKRHRSTIKRLVSELNARRQLGRRDSKTSVRFYEGVESMKAQVRGDFEHARDEILNIFSFDDAGRLLEQVGLDFGDMAKRRRRARLKRRIIFTYRKQPPSVPYPRAEAIYVPYRELPLKADIAIAGDRVSFVPYDSPVRGVAIDDPTIADGMRSVFNLLWSKYDKT